jgi:hypothetical protein
MPKTTAASPAQALAEEVERLQDAIASDELDWEANYQPHAKKYRDGFNLQSPEQKKQERVEDLQRDISDKKTNLERLQ